MMTGCAHDKNEGLILNGNDEIVAVAGYEIGELLGVEERLHAVVWHEWP